MSKFKAYAIFFTISLCLQSAVAQANIGSDMNGLDQTPGQYKYCPKNEDAKGSQDSQQH
ncbi:MAG: hypothetical protein JSS50_00525 [Proteobacteria bacterium]|nr:hypothetical protein [Pseudomonadota bacterium]